MCDGGDSGGADCDTGDTYYDSGDTYYGSSSSRRRRGGRQDDTPLWPLLVILAVLVFVGFMLSGLR